MNRSVYLCGPITGLTFNEAKYGWRAQVHAALTPFGIECLSPMRSKEGDHFTDAQQKSLSPMGSNIDVMSTPRGLTSRDRFDTLRCGLLFCNVVGATKISAGSMIELGWADGKHTPILLVMEKGNIHEHAMVVDLASWIVPTTEEGIEVAKAVFKSGL
jgi:nucleoside 2-deoxyribosyltransferase